MLDCIVEFSVFDYVVKRKYFVCIYRNVWDRILGCIAKPSVVHVCGARVRLCSRG